MPVHGRAGREREQELGHGLPSDPGSGGGFVRRTGATSLNVTCTPVGMAHMADTQREIYQERNTIYPYITNRYKIFLKLKITSGE